MIVELFEIHDELPEQAEEFIMSLKENIDPYAPFFPQLIGLPASMEKQNRWLHSLYEKYCNDDPETAEEMWNVE